MPSSTTRKRKDSSGDSLISKQEKIRALLKVQLQTFPQKELFQEEIDNWERDLGPFPLPAIEWAFDNWRRSGRWFPVYGDIIDQCITWAPEEKYAKGCSRECRALHGKGYNETDLKILNQLVCSTVLAEGRAREQRLTESEIDELLTRLDRKRGAVPEWRQ